MFSITSISPVGAVGAGVGLSSPKNPWIGVSIVVVFWGMCAFVLNVDLGG
jgi:hypothetical protein